eukprot:TRINITY_DN3150_c0_g1_i3.p1 TRINITY_DN3150_c0_g1~~TRINITY_DN3150_c0_g1_i3.p1  ORF type:complete len:129 (-),score=11.95 TRINITY_DN3150_c0_g1_i3:14-400(-)
MRRRYDDIFRTLRSPSRSKKRSKVNNDDDKENALARPRLKLSICSISLALIEHNNKLLPKELLLKTFSYLQKEDLRKLRLTCRLWKGVADIVRKTEALKIRSINIPAQTQNNQQKKRPRFSEIKRALS